MRVLFSCALLVALAIPMAFGQDTNFANGPQYLLNDGSRNELSFFVRPIATPSMSLSGPPLQIGASNATGDLVAGVQDQTVSPTHGMASPTGDLFPIFYGVPRVNVEISSSQSTAGSQSKLLESILDTAVGQLTTAQALREAGFGVTLPEATVYGKAHTRRATRVYTNADIDRLHGST
jgi:hypothetical protein